MSEERRLRGSERWFALLLKLYPPDFRDEMGEALVEAYRDRCRAAWKRGGRTALWMVYLRALGDSVRNGIGERLRPAVSWRRTGNWGRDIELVVRRLSRAPVFVVAMAGTLTVGLGAFAVVYTVVDKVLLAPLPYEDPDDLYFVWRDYSAFFDLDRGALGGTDVAELQAAGGVIEDAAAMLLQSMTLGGMADSEPEQLEVLSTSPNLFQILGVQPALGRGFAPDEGGPGRPPLVVLGNDIWRTAFDSDPEVIGSDVRLNGEPFTVIGVMGSDFGFVRHSSLGPPQRSDAYVTLPVALAETNPGAGSYAGLMRARAGTAPEAVEAAVRSVGMRVDERDFGSRGLELYPVGMKPDLVEPVRPALIVLGLAGLFLVLVLGINLATLLLVRAVQREREFAVSRALGANRLALVRATLLEGGLLGMLGGAGGALAAVWGTQLLVGLAPLDLPRREFIAMDLRIGALVVGVGLLLGLLAGAVPAAWASRTRLSSLLQSASVRGGGGHGRMRRAMVVAQVALSLVLLSAGALVVRSFDQLLRADPGFRQAGVLTFQTFAPQAMYPTAETLRSLHERLHLELEALPGVSAVGAGDALPMTSRVNQTTVAFPGAPGNAGDEDHDAPLVDYIRTRPGYNETLGIRILAGRDFSAASPEGMNEALIDRKMAETFFPASDPLGTTMRFQADTLTVIGVVDHARIYDVHQDGRPQVHVRYDDYVGRTLYYTIRTGRSPLALMPQVRDAVARVDAELALAEVRSMDQVVAESLRQQRLSAVLVGGFSLGALLLAAMGLFGVVAGSVTRRRHELAVRLALGADHGRVVRLVIGEGFLLVLLGLLVGVPGIYFSGQLIRGLLVGISPFDPLTLVAVAAGLGLVALLSCYLPARRVVGIEPARALRQE